MKTKFDSIESAILDIKQGKMIIVVDDDDRENEGDLIMAAEKATPEQINFMAKFGRGMICAPLSEEKAHQLDLPLQVSKNNSAHGTAFTVTIDANSNISTGISAADRAHTLNLLSSSSKASDFVKPGHIFPLIAKNGGVLVRQGHTEAAVDLCSLSDLTPVGVICEIMNDDGTMSRLDELVEFKNKHQLKLISITDLRKYRLQHENLISERVSIPFSHKYGEFKLTVYKSAILNQEIIALIKENQKPHDELPLVRLHSECFTGDIFGSYRCDCGDQLDQSMKLIEEHGHGVLLYLRQEGRGIGLFNKIKSYALQDQGMDTVEANIHLGFKPDLREYSMASMILKELGLTEFKLLTNNPHKLSALKELGLGKISLHPIPLHQHMKNYSYLLTKKLKLGHLLDDLKSH
jgi:3,4-dihydroxy 2-butanone 4-phosphate synthase/GTP cyclohydrolase II